MKTALSFYSFLVIFALLAVSTWATGHISIVPAIQDVLFYPSEGKTPWLVATLFDAYLAFIWFYVWIAYKETSWLARILWLILVLCLGNMAMGAYMLLAIWRLPAEATVEDLLLRRE